MASNLVSINPEVWDMPKCRERDTAILHAMDLSRQLWTEREMMRSPQSDDEPIPTDPACE